jgi:hypothetical protein
MLGLTRVTAAEGARKGVRVNAICPGPVTETVMSQELGGHAGKKNWCEFRRTTCRFSTIHFAGSGTNRRRNRKRGAVSVLQRFQRHDRAVHQRRRRRRLFLILSVRSTLNAVRSCRPRRPSSRISLVTILKYPSTDRHSRQQYRPTCRAQWFPLYLSSPTARWPSK